MLGFAEAGHLIEVQSTGLNEEDLAKLLAQTAHAALIDAQSAGEFPQKYATFVNGVEGRDIEDVEPPGPIFFVAAWWPAICIYGLEFAKQRSPVRSGHYRDSWFAMANGNSVEDFESIPMDAEVIITNPVPYSRKIEVGHIRVSVPPGVVEDLVEAIRRRFSGLVQVRRKFIPLEGAYVSRHGREMNYPAAVITMTG